MRSSACPSPSPSPPPEGAAMALTLCSNCRLPVNSAASRCPLCGAAQLRSATRHLPVATGAVALLATLAVLARRFA
jgi:predicted amidophosphoribosyltransferase